MNKTFNITADCKPGLHYMVDLHSRLEHLSDTIGLLSRDTVKRILRFREFVRAG